MSRGKKIVGGAFAVIVVALLFAYFALQRADIPYATLEHKYANAASRFIDLPGEFHVHYRDQGNTAGPTILLIHGFGSSLETWEPWIGILRDRYRLVSVDLPGHGLTRAQHFDGSVQSNMKFISAFAKTMHLPRVIVGGNSLGGAVAWNLAIRYPDQISALVLLDASGWEWSRQNGGGSWLFKLMDNKALRNIDKTFIIRQSLLSAYFDQSLVTPAMVQRYVDFSRGPGHREILDGMIVRTMSGADPDVKATEEKLADIHMPTLIIWGDQDAVVNPGDAQKFADAIADSTVIMYPNTGHVPMEEAATRTAADFDSWMKRIQPELAAKAAN